MPAIVPPRPVERVVTGRPKTRAVKRACLWLGAFAVFLGWFHPEWQDSLPVLALLGASMFAGLTALVLWVVERPREFVELTGGRAWGPVFYIAGPHARHPVSS